MFFQFCLLRCLRFFLSQNKRHVTRMTKIRNAAVQLCCDQATYLHVAIVDIVIHPELPKWMSKTRCLLVQLVSNPPWLHGDL